MGASLSTPLVLQFSASHSILGGRRREPCVIVGYDGSPAARGAAAWAARRVAPHGRVVLVHADRPGGHWLPVSILGTAAERESHRRALLEELLVDADEVLREVSIDAEVLDEEPAKALLDAARRHAAQEIVIGSHRRSAPERFCGDVAAELARTTTVPVLIVPLAREPSELSGEPLEPLPARGAGSGQSAVG